MPDKLARSPEQAFVGKSGHPDRAWTSGLAYGTGSAANAGQLADCRECYNLRWNP
jgi:hypothetical protein